MNIHHYHPQLGVWAGDDTADENPLEPGNPLVPAYATPRPVPDAPAGSVAVYLGSDGTAPHNWQDGEWQVQPDFRGVPIFSTKDGGPYPLGKCYNGIGLLPEDATTQPRPSRAHFWSGAAWVLDPVEDAKQRKAAAVQERTTRVDAARDAMVPLEFASELGEATDAEGALLKAWKRYIVALSRVDVSALEIQWPEPPVT